MDRQKTMNWAQEHLAPRPLNWMLFLSIFFHMFVSIKRCLLCLEYPSVSFYLPEPCLCCPPPAGFTYALFGLWISIIPFCSWLPLWTWVIAAQPAQALHVPMLSLAILLVPSWARKPPSLWGTVAIDRNWRRDIIFVDGRCQYFLFTMMPYVVIVGVQAVAEPWLVTLRNCVCGQKKEQGTVVASSGNSAHERQSYWRMNV